MFLQNLSLLSQHGDSISSALEIEKPLWMHCPMDYSTSDAAWLLIPGYESWHDSCLNLSLRMLATQHRCVKKAIPCEAVLPSGPSYRLRWQPASTLRHVSEQIVRWFQNPDFEWDQFMVNEAETGCPCWALPNIQIDEQNECCFKPLSLEIPCKLVIHNQNNLLIVSDY